MSRCITVYRLSCIGMNRGYTGTVRMGLKEKQKCKYNAYHLSRDMRFPQCSMRFVTCMYSDLEVSQTNKYDHHGKKNNMPSWNSIRWRSIEPAQLQRLGRMLQCIGSKVYCYILQIANNKDANRPARLRRLVCAFVVCIQQYQIYRKEA